MAKQSCIRCDRFTACKDPQKSIIYFCDRFKGTRQSERQERAFLEDIFETPFSPSTESGLLLPKRAIIRDPNDTGGFNVEQLINEVLEDRRIVSPDIKIPEGDFAEAPNFYTWCVDDEFLDQKPFVMQAMIGTKLFGEYCPQCSDVEWMEHGIRVKDSLGKFVEKVALLEYGECPYCALTRLQMYRRGLLNPYYELALSAGQRSGKSALFGMMASYLTHRMIKLERPNEVFGLLKANVLQGTFVALTFAQAKDTLWEPFYGHLLEAPWFVNYHNMLDEVQQRHGEDEVYKLKDTFVFYRHRRIQVYPAGPDKRVLRGRTRFVSGIDELGWFPNDVLADKNIKMNANQVYIALERSLLTVRSKAKEVIMSGFYNVPFGYFINISSPSSVRDKIMELVRKSQGSKKMLGMCLPTWKMNPHVPRSALNEEFRKDPDSAMRDYGAQPPLTNSPFISTPERVEECYSKRKQLLKLKYRTIKSRDKMASELYAELDECRPGGKPSVLALDAGHCLAGDSLITSALGLVPIQELGEQRGDACVLRVAGKDSSALTTNWYYNGIKQTYKVAVKSGHTSVATRNHQHLVLRDGVHASIPVAKLRVGDLLCINPQRLVRTQKLSLKLSVLERKPAHNNTSGTHGVYYHKLHKTWLVILYVNGTRIQFGEYHDKAEAIAVRNKVAKQHNIADKNTSSKKLKAPKYMSPELAFIIGALISEGYFNTYYTSISNCNHAYLDKLHQCFFSVFGQESAEYSGAAAGSPYTMNGRSGYTTKDSYNVHVSSVQLSKWWEELGLLSSIQHGRKSSYHKVVPWSILQADHVSQAAFLAAYIEGDGSIRQDRSSISIGSKSQKLLAQLQILTSAHGILMNMSSRGCSIVTASAHDYDLLYALIEQHLTHKQRVQVPRAKSCTKYGFSSKHFTEFLASRVVKSHKCAGLKFVTDAGTVLEATGRIRVGATFLYESYDAGLYDEFLDLLRKVSLVEYKKLKQLFDCRYRYSEIVSITKGDKVPVYDLSIERTKAPFFTSNGLIVHNSNNSFAFAVGHLAPNGYPVISLVGEVMPTPGIRINHSLLYTHLLSEIATSRNVVIVSADRWNSLKVLADMEQEFGCAKQQYSLRYDDMQLFKSYIDDKQIQFPRPSQSLPEIIKYDHSQYPECFKHKPVEHLMLQMLTVQDTGTAVIKGDGLTDDILRAAMLCFRMLIDEDNLELLSQPEADVGQIYDMSKMAVSKFYSGGGLGGSGSQAGGGMQSNNSLGLMKVRSE